MWRDRAILVAFLATAVAQLAFGQRPSRAEIADTPTRPPDDGYAFGCGVGDAEACLGGTLAEIRQLRVHLGDTYYAAAALAEDTRHPARKRHVLGAMLRAVRRRMTGGLLTPMPSRKLPPLLTLLSIAGETKILADYGGAVACDQDGRAVRGVTTSLVHPNGSPAEVRALNDRELAEATQLVAVWRQRLDGVGIRCSECSAFVIPSRRTFEVLTQHIAGFEHGSWGRASLLRRGNGLYVVRSQADWTEPAIVLAEAVFSPRDIDTDPFMAAIGLHVSDGELVPLYAASDLQHLLDRLQAATGWGYEVDPPSDTVTTYSRPEEVATTATRTRPGQTEEGGGESAIAFNPFTGRHVHYGLRWIATVRLMEMGITGQRTACLFDNGHALQLAPSTDRDLEIEGSGAGLAIRNAAAPKRDEWLKLGKGARFTRDARYAAEGLYSHNGQAVALVTPIELRVPHAIVRGFGEGQNTWMIDDAIEANLLGNTSIPLAEGTEVAYDSGLVSLIGPGSEVLDLPMFSQTVTPGRVSAVFMRAIAPRGAFVVDDETGEALDIIPFAMETVVVTPAMRAGYVRSLARYYARQGRKKEAADCMQYADGLAQP